MRFLRGDGGGLFDCGGRREFWRGGKLEFVVGRWGSRTRRGTVVVIR